MPEKISFIPIDLARQKPTECREGFIELYDSYLHYKIEFVASEPSDDDGLVWEDGIFNSVETFAFKDKISGVEKSYTDNKKWVVMILVADFGVGIKIYFKSRTSAQQMLDKLTNWLFPVPTPDGSQLPLSGGDAAPLLPRNLP